MPWLAAHLLGLFLLTLGVALALGLVAVWPAVEAATAQTPAPTEISYLGLSYTASPGTALILLVVVASAVGSYVHVGTSFGDYVGNRRLAVSWTWWYLLRVPIGVTLALLFYFAIRGGLFGADTPDSVINPYGIAALAGLVGLFSKQATDKLREVFDTLFRVGPGYGDEARSDSIANPEPLITEIRPPMIPPGDADVPLTIRGEGFIPESVVRVSRPDMDEAEVVERKSRLVGPTELTVTLTAEDVREPGTWQLVVVNPEPGGGVSRPASLVIQPPTDDDSQDSLTADDGEGSPQANDETPRED